MAPPIGELLLQDMTQWVAQILDGAYGEPTRFIALRPLTGTGKEEEVLETNDIPRYCEHCGSEEHYTSEHY